MRRFLLFLFLLVLSEAVFSGISPLSSQTQQLMRQYTWQPGCPVPLRDLVEVKLTYWGFDHRAHEGTLVVHKEVAKEVVAIFENLYRHQFPIERMEPMEAFKGDDVAAMNANNTSAFNCRAVTGGGGVYSRHSEGRAIDVNPLINPYVKGGVILPSASRLFAYRHQSYKGKITKDSVIYKAFARYGWRWGGNWQHLHDYQHFEKNK